MFSKHCGLLICGHMQSKGPFKSLINGVPPGEVVDKIIKSMRSFPGFHFAFEYTTLILGLKPLHFASGGPGVHATLVEVNKEVVENVLEIHSN